jgi:hypothetical protein
MVETRHAKARGRTATTHNVRTSSEAHAPDVIKNLSRHNPHFAIKE